MSERERELERRLRGLVEPNAARAGSKRVARGLGEAADERGLLDVAIGRVDSPVGSLLIAVTPRGLVRLSYASEDTGEVLAELAERVSPRILESPARTDAVRRELDEYFAGSRREFDLAVDLALTTAFGARTLRAATRIPYGQVTTYGALAEQIRAPRAARAIGNALGANPVPIVVPCHRVVRAGGALGGYGGGLQRKRALLRLEEEPPS
jgi:methylated-DNA-[protein]-cysteine S-methyltransferase